MPRALIRPLVAAFTVAALALAPILPAEAVEPTGTVRGVVSDSVGELLVGDETRITVELYREEELATPSLTVDLVSSEHGGFEIPDVPVGRYAVRFVSHDWGHVGEWWGDTRRAAEREFIDVTAGGTITLDPRLTSTVLLTGSIAGRDVPLAPGGEPVHVVATTGDAELDAWLPLRETQARVEGMYALRLIPGNYDVTFSDTTGAHYPQTETDVEVTSLRPTLDAALEAARGSLNGELLLRTADGVVPLTTGASTMLYRWSAADSRWIETDHCGIIHKSTFLLDCLPAGRYKYAATYDDVVSFWGGGDLAGAPEIELAENQTLAIDEFVIDDPAKASGVVATRLADGSIVPRDSAEVSVWRKTDTGDWQPVPRSPHTTPTTGDGAFDVSLAPGTYVFRVWVDSPYEGATYLDDARFFEDAPRVTLGLGEQRDLGTIVLPGSSFEVERVAGVDRFATAIAVSERVIPDGERAPVVYLTNAYNFPDALAAGPAATQQGGVILPVPPDALPTGIADELHRLQPSRVVLAGGTGVISDAVRAAVKEVVPADTDVVRLGGAGRYETADLIVRDAFAEGSRFAFIATGASFPDALAAGPAAGHLGAPVLLVDGSKGLTAATKARLATLGVTDVYIAGGPGVVSAAIEQSLRSLLGATHVTRLSGPDRIHTAIAINEEIFGSVDDAFVASASGFADALAGGPLAAAKGGPLYLSGPKCLDFYTVEGLRYRQIARLSLLGGTGVLSSGVASLKTCS